MTDMNSFYKQFIREEFDGEGNLKNLELTLKEDFNFGYDVIDEIAKAYPDKKMLHWVNDHGGEKIFTYEDMRRLTNQCANMMLAHGVKKGDMLLAVLKRHYEFWILAYGLIKIGCVLIPATSQLMPKDYIYRFNAAGVKYVCATYFDEVADRIDEACKTYDGIKEKFICRGQKDGWTDFMEELSKYPDTLEKQPLTKHDYMLAYCADDHANDMICLVLFRPNL